MMNKASDRLVFISQIEPVFIMYNFMSTLSLNILANIIIAHPDVSIECVLYPKIIVFIIPN